LLRIFIIQLSLEDAKLEKKVQKQTIKNKFGGIKNYYVNFHLFIFIHELHELTLIY